MLVLDGVNSNLCFWGYSSNDHPEPAELFRALPSRQKKGAKNGNPNSSEFGKSLLTPKTYMEPQHGGLEDAFPVKKWDFQVPAVSFQRCRDACLGQKMSTYDFLSERLWVELSQ